MMTMSMLMRYDAQVQQIARAEQADGWLVQCVDRSIYLALTSEFVAATAAQLRELSDGSVLEIASGEGALTEALCHEGLKVIATDVSSTDATQVVTMSAASALQRYRPKVVVGSFVPFDSGIDVAVLSDVNVQHYLVLNARINGSLGSSALWQRNDWQARPLEELSRWMLMRHDVWLGKNKPMLCHGEAWLFSRAT